MHDFENFTDLKEIKLYSLYLLDGDDIAGGMGMDARQHEQPIHLDASLIMVINYSLFMS